MQFERTSDIDLIRSIIQHPKVWDMSADDYAPNRESFQPLAVDSLYYILVHDGPELLGMFTFIPLNAICWEVHTTLLPVAYGKRAVDSGEGVMQWVWDNTPCLRIVTNVPNFNRLALRFAERCGLQQFGVNERSYQKHGILHNQILLGISKPQGT